MGKFRQEMTVTFETGEDIDDFREFIKFHAKRLRCQEEEVMSRLVTEWKKMNMKVELLPPKIIPKKPRKKKDDDPNTPKIYAEGEGPR